MLCQWYSLCYVVGCWEAHTHHAQVEEPIRTEPLILAIAK